MRRLRDEGKTLNEIAALVGCGRSTVARALAREPGKALAGSRLPLSERAAELARNRTHVARDTEARLRVREHARHLVHCRWSDGMKVDGEIFQPVEPKREEPRWAGVLLMAGGLLLWAIGCPVPL